MKIRLTLETEMKNCLSQKKKVADIGALDEQIVFLKAPFLQYEQILLPKNFRQYPETVIISLKVLSMGLQNRPYQKNLRNANRLTRIYGWF